MLGSRKGQPTRRAFLQSAAALAVRPPGGTSHEASEERDFLEVPNSYRLRMHWYIFGPAWTAEECDRQLKLMAVAHVGGVLIFPTYPIAVDDPEHGIQNQSYLSAEFFSVLNSVLGTCKKLGLTADMVLGTGWPYGGPSVALADSAHRLHRVSIPVTTSEPIQLPALDEHAKIISVFYVDPSQVTSVNVRPDGTITPLGTGGEVQIFYSSPTRMQVKRASVGAEGLVLDHYNADATERYLIAVGDKLLADIPAGTLRSIFCDSLEVYHTNWTDDFAGIFQSKRGYDLIPHLPALFDQTRPDSRDLRCDFWRTLSEQAFDGFIQPLSQWAQRHGVTTQVEAYGTPPVSLASYRAVDVPVGEHYEWKEFNTSRWASSGAHLAGKRVILAEAWTWLGEPNRFGDSLEQLKFCSDLHFLSGINSLYGVTYAYSPVALGAPGWPPYFGPVANHTQPFWPYFSHLADYVNRASFILQQGKPVADVALYLPSEDAMAEARVDELLFNWAVRDRMTTNGQPPEFGLKNALQYEADVVKTMVANGYSFDGVDTFAFREMRVEKGRLRSGDGDYGVLVLPNLTGIDLDSLRKIGTFVEQGGILIATRRLPERAYGMRDRERNNIEVEQFIRQMFGRTPEGVALCQNRYGRGVAILSRDEGISFLNALRWHEPDIIFRTPSDHVGFAHRSTSERDYYFLANTGERAERLDATFRVGAKQPEWWDLKTGGIKPVAIFEHVKAGTRISFELGPLESRVIAFKTQQGAPAITDSDLDLQLERNGWKALAPENRAFFIQRSNGKRENIIISDVPPPIPLVSLWRLSFEDVSIETVELDVLKSWTEIPAARHFSGRGIYEAGFQFSKRAADAGVVLDLGQVRETADVRLNGEHTGVAWMRPYQMEITHLLRSGANHLRIEVTNLLINKVLGMGPIDYSAVYARYGNRFPPGDEWEKVREPFASGLLGPVQLRFYKIISGARKVPSRRRHGSMART
ncbi:MAG: hypothetical protein DMG57_16710 [Acidobacteria bacterium]|nr:MAG: hypothetical protein DMG57_16710 [Acidobacteriota bacterium]